MVSQCRPPQDDGYRFDPNAVEFYAAATMCEVSFMNGGSVTLHARTCGAHDSPMFHVNVRVVPLKKDYATKEAFAEALLKEAAEPSWVYDVRLGVELDLLRAAKSLAYVMIEKAGMAGQKDMPEKHAFMMGLAYRALRFITNPG